MDPEFRARAQWHLNKVGHDYIWWSGTVVRGDLSQGSAEGVKCRDSSGRTYFKFPHSAHIEVGNELQLGGEKWVVTETVSMLGYVDCEVRRVSMHGGVSEKKMQVDVKELRNKVNQLIGIVGSVIESSKPSIRIGKVDKEYAECHEAIERGVIALQQMGFSAKHDNQFKDIASLYGFLKTNYRSWHDRRQAVRHMYEPLFEIFEKTGESIDAMKSAGLSIDELKNTVRLRVKEDNEIRTDLGRLRLEKEIGEGANALVFATDFAGPAVAKFLACAVTEPPESRYARFVDEFRMLVRLANTGRVVRVFHFDTLVIAGTRLPFMIMERCQQTLSGQLLNNPITTGPQFFNLAEQLLEAVGAVNDAGIVHRDLKPQNILIREDGAVVLGDFGIAWFDPSHYEKLAHTKPAERLANFMFSAPEQFDRDTTPAPTMDIYAVGQILYWSATKQVIRGTEHKPLGTVNPILSAFDPVINQMVRSNPEDRFETAGQALGALRQSAAVAGFSGA